MKVHISRSRDQRLWENLEIFHSLPKLGIKQLFTFSCSLFAMGIGLSWFFRLGMPKALPVPNSEIKCTSSARCVSFQEAKEVTWVLSWLQHLKYWSGIQFVLPFTELQCISGMRSILLSP